MSPVSSFQVEVHTSAPSIRSLMSVMAFVFSFRNLRAERAGKGLLAVLVKLQFSAGSMHKYQGQCLLRMLAADSAICLMLASSRVVLALEMVGHVICICELLSCIAGLVLLRCHHRNVRYARHCGCDNHC